MNLENPYKTKPRAKHGYSYVHGEMEYFMQAHVYRYIEKITRTVEINTTDRKLAHTQKEKNAVADRTASKEEKCQRLS